MARCRALVWAGALFVRSPASGHREKCPAVRRAAALCGLAVRGGQKRTSATAAFKPTDGAGAVCTRFAHSSRMRKGCNSRDPNPQHMEGALPGPQGHLGDKADLTPSPLRVSGGHRGGLTGETNDVVRCYGFALTEQASVTLLMPRRNHCSPWMDSHGGGAGENGAERNRTAVRNTGVDHLVGPKTDL